MRILVTGAEGFIGKNLMARLRTMPAVEVKGIDLVASAHPDVTIADAGTTALVGTFRPDVIVHLAGSAGVRESDARPLHYIDNNLRVTAHLFEEARLHGVRRIVYASSSSVYGDSSGVCDSSAAAAGRATVEADAVGCVQKSVYGLSKRFCEEVAEYYHHRYGVESVGLRFFTVYGPHGRLNMAVGAFAKAIAAGTPITVFGDGSQARDFTHVFDIVDGIVASCVAPVATDHVFNIGANDPHTVVELIELLKDLLNKPEVEIVFEVKHSADVDRTHADNSKFRSMIGHGLGPPMTLSKGLEQYVWWLSTQHTNE